MAQTHFLSTFIFAVLYQALADDTIHVLSYNVQQFGRKLQKITGGSTDTARIEALPQTAFDATKLKPDLICFQEAFSDKFNAIVENWREEAGYQYRAGLTSGFKSQFKFVNSGVILLSRTELEDVQTMTFKAKCGTDGLAAKGIVYAETKIRNRRVGIIATHLQADDRLCAWLAKDVPAAAEKVRTDQLSEIKTFLNDKVLSKANKPDVILLVGDLNIDSWDQNLQSPSFAKISKIMSTVSAEAPVFGGSEAGAAQPTTKAGEVQPTTSSGAGEAQPALRASYDPFTNTILSKQKAKARYHLDYVLALDGGRSDVKVINEVVKVEKYGGDLSDHHAVLGRVTFPTPFVNDDADSDL